MNNRGTRSNLAAGAQDGFAVITSLLVVLVVGVFIVGALSAAQIEAFIARNDSQATQAQYVAVAGMQKYRTATFQNYRYEQEKATDDATASGACGIQFGKYRNIDFDRTGTSSTDPWARGERLTVAVDEPVFDAAGVAIGFYGVEIIKDSDSVFVIESRGRSGTASAIARAALTVGDAGALEQALFAASGSNAKAINGNISIRGSVFIEGFKADPKPIVLTAGGNYSQKNYYRMSDYGADLQNRVDTEHQQMNDLCAALRIKDGQLELTSGSVSVGESSGAFAGAEPRIQGVFVDGGTQDIIASGNLIDNKTGEFKCNTSGGLCAREIGAYDLPRIETADTGPLPVFPRLDGGALNPGCVLASYSSPTWRQCISGEIDEKLNGLRINSTTAASLGGGTCSAAISGTTLTLGAYDVDCTDGTHGFKYTASTGLLEVYGTVEIEGLNMKANQSLQYRARGDMADPFSAEKNATLFIETNPSTGAGGSISIDGSLLPDATATFPQQVLGLVAEKNVTFSKQTDAMAPIYAGQAMYITHQSKLFGSAIANSFCTTSAGGTECNAGQAVEIIHVSTRGNRPTAFQHIAGGTAVATFTSLAVEVN